MPLTTQEIAELDAANDRGKQPVVFVHGLWLLSSSWDRWRRLFEAVGYSTLAPDWPDDPATVAEVSDHYLEAIGTLRTTPAVVGHSFGGLIAQQVAGEGAAAATVAVDPAPGRGVLPLPVHARTSGTLGYDEFKYGWANELDDEEAKALYEGYVAASRVPDPSRGIGVRFDAEDRGPILIVSGEKDHTVPHAIAYAAYKRHRGNTGVTEFVELPGRGHSLTIDHGWLQVAQTALDFVVKNAPAA